MQTPDVSNAPPNAPPWRTDEQSHFRRRACALLATGAFALLAGVVFMMPFALSPYANQNDVYLGNYSCAPVFFVWSVLGVVAGLLRLGRSREEYVREHRLGMIARALLLAIVGAAGVVIATFLLGGRYTSIGPDAPDWPLYLTLPLLAATLGIGIVVGTSAWFWAGGPVARREGANAR